MWSDYPGDGSPLHLAELPSSYTDLHGELVARLLQANQAKKRLQELERSNSGLPGGVNSPGQREWASSPGGGSSSKAPPQGLGLEKSEARPALCLLCGQVENADGKGACTAHAARCGLGTGAFFLLQECLVVLMHGPRACYLASPYVDDHGERHGQFRGRPLYLDQTRLQLLRDLTAHHEVSGGDPSQFRNLLHWWWFVRLK